MSTAQQLLNLTACGVGLRHFGAISTPKRNPALIANPNPTGQQVTPIISPRFPYNPPKRLPEPPDLLNRVVIPATAELVPPAPSRRCSPAPGG
jgi:hypothetical protein